MKHLNWNYIFPVSSFFIWHCMLSNLCSICFLWQRILWWCKILSIADSTPASKFILFEEYVAKMKSGDSLIIRESQFHGRNPPYRINITKNTSIFNTAPIKVPEEVEDRARTLLPPPLCVWAFSTAWWLWRGKVLR